MAKFATTWHESLQTYIVENRCTSIAKSIVLEAYRRTASERYSSGIIYIWGLPIGECPVSSFDMDDRIIISYHGITCDVIYDILYSISYDVKYDVMCDVTYDIIDARIIIVSRSLFRTPCGRGLRFCSCPPFWADPLNPISWASTMFRSILARKWWIKVFAQI